ncbi:type II secretion system protein GspM [Limnohabitans sp. JirII-31]|uniref:type II secretion system protein GspM n=1 Tax=Limnohabitans sp. JirII-31 TaxID=1977908 RepID=UPI000C1EAC17|nr:type II secretion system protein GspM [Limnohabitans sp. JirII-31]PIT79706.1 hypothetical protein B9Z41_03725 [Limnohabitans sp. JirII-31]
MTRLHSMKTSWRATVSARWQALSGNKQRSLTWLGWVLLAALVYSLSVAPAWRTLRHSDAQRAQLTQQVAHMQALQAQTQALQQRTPLPRDEALRTLQSLSSPHGPAMQLNVQGDRVTVQLKALPASALATWLSQIRAQAQTLPIEAHLTQTNAASASVRWSGSLVLRLPSRSPNADTSTLR